MLGRRRHEVDDVVVEGDEPDTVTLALREDGESRRKVASVIELGDPCASEVHRARDVENDGEVRVGVRLELLDVEPVRTRKQAPIDLANVVPRHVRTMLGEIHRASQIGRSMKPADEALNHRTRQQLEVGNPPQQVRIDELPHPLAPWRRFRHLLSSNHIRDFGASTVSSNWSMRVSDEIFSLCAWKFVRMRWRNTGFARARMSS